MGYGAFILVCAALFLSACKPSQVGGPTWNLRTEDIVCKDEAAATQLLESIKKSSFSDAIQKAVYSKFKKVVRIAIRPGIDGLRVYYNVEVAGDCDDSVLDSVRQLARADIEKFK